MRVLTVAKLYSFSYFTKAMSSPLSFWLEGFAKLAAALERLSLSRCVSATNARLKLRLLETF
jgi:hypothetical protein